ncbi:MAG: hypothetical protein KDJ77_06515 [Rhodobiaceae bacterium]|nr:hypothetical protein [Rhodobiaceae bacterium]
MPVLKPWPIGFWDFFWGYVFGLFAATFAATWLVTYAMTGGGNGPADAVVDFFLSAMMMIWAPFVAIAVVLTVGPSLFPVAALAVSLFGLSALRSVPATLAIGLGLGCVVGLAALFFEPVSFSYPVRIGALVAAFGISGAVGAYAFRMLVLYIFPALNSAG